MKRLFYLACLSVAVALSGCASAPATQTYADQVRLVCAIAQPNLALLTMLNPDDAAMLTQVGSAVTTVCNAPNSSIQDTQFNLLIAASNALVSYLITHPRQSPPIATPAA